MDNSEASHTADQSGDQVVSESGSERHHILQGEDRPSGERRSADQARVACLDMRRKIA